MKRDHPPISNTAVLLTIFALIFTPVIWAISTSWGFLWLIFFIILFIASFVSATRAPLMNDHDIELALHEKYQRGRYPDTDLHEGHIKSKKVFPSPRARMHKKLLEMEKKKKTKKQAVKKTVAKRKTAKKKPVKKVVRKPVKRKPVRRTIKKVKPRRSTKVAKRKPSKRVVKKKVTKKKTTRRKKR